MSMRLRLISRLGALNPSKPPTNRAENEMITAVWNQPGGFLLLHWRILQNENQKKSAERFWFKKKVQNELFLRKIFLFLAIPLLRKIWKFFSCLSVIRGHGPVSVPVTWFFMRCKAKQLYTTPRAHNWPLLNLFSEYVKLYYWNKKTRVQPLKWL